MDMNMNIGPCNCGHVVIEGDIYEQAGAAVVHKGAGGMWGWGWGLGRV